jgi:hypothetical protein
MDVAHRVHLVERELHAGKIALPEYRLNAGQAAEHADLDAVGGDARAVLRRGPQPGDASRSASPSAVPSPPAC